MWLLSTHRTDAQRTGTLQAFAGGNLAMCWTSRALPDAVLCCFLGHSALGGASGRDTLGFTLSAVWHQDRTTAQQAQTMVSEQ